MGSRRLRWDVSEDDRGALRPPPSRLSRPGIEGRGTEENKESLGE